MKKHIYILFSLAVILSFSSIKSEAQIKYGIKGGINFTSFSNFELGNISEAVNSFTGYNAGVAVNFQLPYGFAIQPELLYVSKGARFTGDAKFRLLTDFVEIPVNVQIGLDLIMLRPFLAITPYIGYAVRKDFSMGDSGIDISEWNQIKRFQYGIGIGGGVDFWKFQLSVRYNWNFGKLTKINTDGVTDIVTEKIIETINKGNYRGLEVSIAFFF